MSARGSRWLTLRVPSVSLPATMFPRLLLLALLSSSALSCASVDARRSIREGDELVREARTEEADRYAKYELTKAVLYLDEARLRNGYGEYAAARAYGGQAVELARSAVQTARQRKDLELRRQKTDPETPKARTPRPKPLPGAPDLPGLPPVGAPEEPEGDGAAPADQPKKKLLPPGMGGGQ